MKIEEFIGYLERLAKEYAEKEKEMKGKKDIENTTYAIYFMVRRTMAEELLEVLNEK